MVSKGHRSSAGMEHDFQKFCVEYWADPHYDVEKEAQGEGEGKRPDLVLHLKKYRKDTKTERFEKVIVEVQRDIYTDNWLQKTMKKYEHEHLIVIRIENYEKLPRKVAMRTIGRLLDRDTRPPSPEKEDIYKPPKNTPDDTPLKPCQNCGKPKKEKNLYQGLCKKCRRAQWRKENG